MNNINDYLSSISRENSVSFDKLKDILNNIPISKTVGINKPLNDSLNTNVSTIEELKIVLNNQINHERAFIINQNGETSKQLSTFTEITDKRIEQENNISVYSEPPATTPQYLLTAKKKTSKLCIKNYLLYLVILSVSISSFLWFATTIVQIGGKTNYGETLNLYEFIYAKDNSIYSQVLTSYNQILTSINNSDTDLTVVSSVLKVIRVFFYLLPSVIVSIAIIINVISATVGICKNNFALLAKTAIGSITNKFIAYICFSFFGNISGGYGEDSYCIGYSIGAGMTISILLALTLLNAVIISKLIKNKQNVSRREMALLQKYYCVAIFSSAIAIVLPSIKLYSISVLIIESALTSTASIIQNFTLSVLIFPVLNLIIFYACINLYKICCKNVFLSYNYLLNDSSIKTTNLNLSVKQRKFSHKSSLHFYKIIIWSLLAITSVVVLTKTEYGLGWKTDFYPQLVLIFTFSLIGQSIVNYISRKNNNN